MGEMRLPKTLQDRLDQRARRGQLLDAHMQLQASKEKYERELGKNLKKHRKLDKARLRLLDLKEGKRVIEVELQQIFIEGEVEALRGNLKELEIALQCFANARFLKGYMAGELGVDPLEALSAFKVSAA